MRRSSMLALLALVCLIGTAQAQATDTSFTPGPHNDPSTCSGLWKGVGLPVYAREQERDTIIVCHTRYVLSHNNADKTPDWVLEHLTRAQVSGTNSRPRVKFKPDPFVPPDKRAVDGDYTNSKFDRGHQAPSEDFNENRQWMIESFILSNVVPQVGVGFNQGIWKSLEAHVRDLARARGELYVITGPVYPGELDGETVTIKRSANRCHETIVLKPLPRTSICGARMSGCVNGVTVPVALYKIVYDPYMQRANAFIMPNIKHRSTRGLADPFDYIRKYQVTVRMVERLTGLEFFPALAASTRRSVVSRCAEPMEH